MNIAAKGSAGVFAECPQCHSSMAHGFQVCQTCGHTVSAQEQVGLQKLLARNVIFFAIVSLLLFCVFLAVAYQYLR